jgi:hypothetical protein
LENVALDTDQLILNFNNTKTSIGGEFCRGVTAHAQEIREQSDSLEEQIVAYKAQVAENADQAVNDLDLIIHVATEADDQLEKASKSCDYYGCCVYCLLT